MLEGSMSNLLCVPQFCATLGVLVGKGVVEGGRSGNYAQWFDVQHQRQEQGRHYHRCYCHCYCYCYCYYLLLPLLLLLSTTTTTITTTITYLLLLLLLPLLLLLHSPPPTHRANRLASSSVKSSGLSLCIPSFLSRPIITGANRRFPFSSGQSRRKSAYRTRAEMVGVGWELNFRLDPCNIPWFLFLFYFFSSRLRSLSLFVSRSLSLFLILMFSTSE